MISAESFVAAARQRGWSFWTGVPCSYLTPFINYTISATDVRYVGAANEGDAVAMAAGAVLGGVGAVVMMQNSGLGNAVNPLTSLAHAFRIPMLLIVTLRGDPKIPDEPQHRLMGAITPRLLELMEIPWEPFPDDAAAVEATVARAAGHMAAASTPYALIMRKGTVEPCPLRPSRAAGVAADRVPLPARAERSASRTEMLRAVQASCGADDLLVATTGFTGRELYALDDRAGQLYMVGSMGCAAGLGLGLALARPDRRVVVLDGDGALLMRMGLLATVGHERPPNLVHVLLDNGAHESTGGQATVADTVDFAAAAAACGYPRVHRAARPEALAALLRERSAGPHFVHAPIRVGHPADLPRPAIAPYEVARRFRAALHAE